MPFVVARDQQSIYVRVCGRGTPVLLLHGVGMDSRHWLPFVLPLMHRFRFYMVDFRGAGQSKKAPFNQPDMFSNLTDDVQDIIQHFSLENFILVGYSLGASTALHLMRRGGFSQVARYLHIDQSPSIKNPEDWPYGLMGQQQTPFFNRLEELHSLLERHRHLDRLAALPGPDRLTAINLLTDALVVAAGHPQIEFVLKKAAQFPDVFSYLVRDISLATLRIYLSGYFQNSHDYRDALRANDTDTTYFIGMKSILYHFQGQQEMVNMTKNAKAVYFKEGGHLLQLDEPLRFAKEFRRFLLA